MEVKRLNKDNANNGPWSRSELHDHLYNVVEALKKTDDYRLCENIETVMPEGEGHGILIEYESVLKGRHIMSLLENGYVITTADAFDLPRDQTPGRVFVTTISGDYTVQGTYPDFEDQRSKVVVGDG